MKEFKGQIAGFPKEVVKKMCKRQVQQGNKKDVGVFENCKKALIQNGGFIYAYTKEGQDWWFKVLNGDFELFFKRYPKKEKVIFKNSLSEVFDEVGVKAWYYCTSKLAVNFVMVDKNIHLGSYLTTSEIYKTESTAKMMLERFKIKQAREAGKKIECKCKTGLAHWGPSKASTAGFNWDTFDYRIAEEEPEEKPFPKYMVSRKGRVVLFSAAKEGVLVGYTKNASNISYRVGHQDKTWHMPYFKDCEVEIKVK